ncbi:MAG: hypothetical protein H7257_04625 [Taibaiella sp.]|nr:hypothetical protein [Taibaiella sp.]
MFKKLFFALLPLIAAAPAFAQDKEEADEQKQQHTYRPNKIISVSPIQFTENGVGFSLGYEQGIDKDGIVSFMLPVMATFNLAHNDLQNGNKQDAMYYFMPGIKFYPTSSHGLVKYSIGPSLVIGAGQQTDMDYNQYTTSVYPYYNGYVTRDKFHLGVMLNNSMNITPTPHFYLGLDFGFGFTYLTRIDNINQGTKGLVQGGFRMGYKF